MANPMVYPSPNPQTPYHSSEDLSRLLSITEESIFLHDGVFRAQDLVSKNFNHIFSFQDSGADISQLEELLAIGTSDTQELGCRIQRLSTMRVQDIGRHHRYQLQILKEMWKYKRQRALEQEAEKETEEVAQREAMPEIRMNSSSNHLGLKLSLSLLIPLLQSISETNEAVALGTVQLLFDELSNVPPMSLAQESSKSLGMLEDLMCHWVQKNGDSFRTSGSAALIALSCARGRLPSFVKTISVIEQCGNMSSMLPVRDVLHKLKDTGIQISKPCAIMANKHILTWPYDTDLQATAIETGKELGISTHRLLNFSPMQTQPENTTASSSQGTSTNSRIPKKEDDLPARHFVATDGSYLYVTGPKGKGISKVGSGFQGLIRGWVYSKNVELNCGYLAMSDFGLLSRPIELDNYEETVDGKSVFGVMVNRVTLVPSSLVLFETEDDLPKPYLTIGLTSDGESIFLIRAELPFVAQSAPGQSNTLTGPVSSSKFLNVYLDVYQIKEDEDENSGLAFAFPVRKRMVLQKPDDLIAHHIPSFDTDPNDRERRQIARRIRSMRASNLQPTLAIQAATAMVVATSENYMTSLGVYFKQLTQCTVFTCGNYLTFIAANFWPPIQGFSPPLPNTGAPAVNLCNTSNTPIKQYVPIMSQHCSKVLGSQIHIALKGARPAFYKQDFANMPITSSFFYGAILQQMGSVYDSMNNIIWTTNGDYMDMWQNSGHIPVWKQNELMLFKPVREMISSKTEISIRDSISSIMEHIGRMSLMYLFGDQLEADIGFSPNVLPDVLDLVFRCLRNFEAGELKSIFSVLKAGLSKIKTVGMESSEYLKVLEQVQVVLSCFLGDEIVNEKFSSEETLYKDVGELFAMIFDFLYFTPESRENFFVELHEFIDKGCENELNAAASRESSRVLKETLLNRFMDNLNNPGLTFEDGRKWVIEGPWFTRTVRDSTALAVSKFQSISGENPALDGIPLTSSQANVYKSAIHRTSVETRYIEAVINFLLRSWVLKANDKLTQEQISLSIESFRCILNHGCVLAESGMEFVSSEENLSLATYLCCETVLKASIMGHAIPQILAFIISEEKGIKALEENVLEECIQLTVAMSHLADKMNCRSSPELGEDWASKLKVPSPWGYKKVIESTHPLRETTKTKETVILPWARQLYLKFSPQCATQYDYDRLIIYQGVGPLAKKIAECGGNYYGYGNRNFTGPGWPRDLIKIDGNVVTYGFDARSTREASTTDKALFGYRFTVYPKYNYSDPDKPLKEPDDIMSYEPIANGLVSLLSLHCIDVIQKIVIKMFLGKQETGMESDSRPILENPLVLRLQWENVQNESLTESPRKFNDDLIEKLKKDAGIAPIQIRSGLREKLKLNELEDLYLQCCMKHLEPNPYINEDIINSESSDLLDNGIGKEVLRGIFRNIEVIVRQVMAVSEMEKMLIQEVEDITKGSKGLSDTFFVDATFIESSNDMKILAMICDLEYDEETPSNLINDATAMIQAFIEGGTAPQLTKSDELIQETFLKLQSLSQAEKRSNIATTDASIDQIKKTLSSLQSFVYCHFINPSSTMKMFYEATKINRSRAISRIDAFDSIIKVVQCSQANSALLTVAGIILMDGPDLSSIACSGYEQEVIVKYGETLKTVISLAERNPLLHRFTVALLCVIRYNRTDEKNLVESGLLSILDQLCAYQMRTPIQTCQTHETIAESNLPMDSSPAISQEVAKVHLKASVLAWAAFRVLANRCATWEKAKQNAFTCFENGFNCELPIQISANVTNHLARAANLAAISSEEGEEAGVNLRKLSCAPSLTDAIQDVLGLLSSLQEYKIGQAILKQSPCICRLLSLLQDPRLSPRLVLTILKLLNIALPLVTDLDTAHFAQIILSKKPGTSSNETTTSSVDLNPYNQVASMLLSKLADFLVCGAQHSPKTEASTRHVCPMKSSTVVTGLLDPTFPKVGVWIKKRTDQLAAPMLRQIFLENSRLDLRPSRASLNQLETELNADGKVLLFTEDSAIAERKAMRLAQLGCIVSLEPAGSMGAITDKAKNNPQSTSVDMVCKEKNANLASWDPPRPFISGQVAECLASEIVQLLRALLGSSKKDLSELSVTSSKGSIAPTGSMSSTITTEASSKPSTIAGEDIINDITAHLNQRNIWSEAVEQVMCLSLKMLPKLVAIPNLSNVPIDQFAKLARLVVASLTVIGAFTETIRSGSEVWIVEGITRKSVEPDEEVCQINSFIPMKGRVLDISESTSTAQVEINEGNSRKWYKVPLSRLTPCHKQTLEESSLPPLSKTAQIEISSYMKALLSPTLSTSKDKLDTFALNRKLPSLSYIMTAAGINSSATLSSKGSECRTIAHDMTVVRLLAEIRTRCMQVLSEWLKNMEFLNLFLQNQSPITLEEPHQSSESSLTVIKSLKLLAKECEPSHRIRSVETQVAWMRLLYRDCTRPPRLAISSEKQDCQEITWNISKNYPKVKSCVLSTATSSVVYAGDYNVVGGLPRGLLLYATYGVPVNGFYWEVTIVTMEDTTQNPDTVLVTPPVSIGFSPEAVPPEQVRPAEAWRYPAGTVVYTIGGRVHHYKSQDPVSWVTNRVELENFKIKAGDTLGIGWERRPAENPQEGGSRVVRRPAGARQIVRPTTPIPPPPPPPPPPVGSSRRVRIRNSNATLPQNRAVAAINNASFGPQGTVFFTLNGKRLPNIVEQSNCGLFPVLHIQKRGVVVATNFGTKQFAYAEAKKYIPVILPHNNSPRRALRSSVSTGSTDSGVLLRRVSDSLQDLNRGLNFGGFTLADMDSDTDINIHPRSDSDDTLSASSSNDGSERIDLEALEELEADGEDSLFGDDIQAGSNNAPFHTAPQQPASSLQFRNTEINPIPNIIHAPSPLTNITSPNEEELQLQQRPDTSARANPSLPTSEIAENRKCNFIAKSGQKCTEYNPITSLDYFLESSPTNGIKIFSGPNRNICSCAAHCPSALDFIMIQKSQDKTEANSSANSGRRPVTDQDVENASSDDEDDIHSQLVRAWEQQVFPIIRRRFRNESERRDGLDQIRGALQLGMIEIARQTVEFLYEEGGAIPRELHLPTIEEVRAEASRCTMERIRPGMSVLIRQLHNLNEINAVLPSYAVPAMMRTFGLVGEVLEIDMVNEMVLIETYVESEGILLRFWYPVAALDKPQMSKKPSLNAHTINLFKLHSNLISLENSLCHMYCRSAFLEILNQGKLEIDSEIHQSSSDFCLSASDNGLNTVLNSVSISSIKKFNLENIQLLSDHYLADFSPIGDLLTHSLSFNCPSLKFLSETGNPSIVFYKDSTLLSKELKATLSYAASQGDEDINDLTSQILSILDFAPEKFPTHEASSDKASNVDILIPESAFTLISVKGLQPPKNAASLVDDVTHACIHLSCYDSGDLKRHPLVCYPVHSMFSPLPPEMSGNGTRIPRNQSGANSVRKTLQVHRRKLRFPTILAATDKIHFSVSEPPLKGLTIQMQGIPSQFPLALIYIQELFKLFAENESISLNPVMFATSKLISFLGTNHMPPTIKEWIISLISEAISLKRSNEGFPLDFVLFQPHIAHRFFLEMLLLYEKESGAVSNAQAHIISTLADNFSTVGINSPKETSAKTTKTNQDPASASSKTTITNIYEATTAFFEENKAKSQNELYCLSGYFQSLLELCLCMNNIYELSFSPVEVIGLPKTCPTSPSTTPQRRLSGQVAAAIAPSAVSQSRNKKFSGPVSKKFKSIAPKVPEVKRDRAIKSQKHQPMPGTGYPSERPQSAKHGASSPISEEPGEASFSSHEFSWFMKAELSLLALRALVWNDDSECCLQALNNLLSNSYESMLVPTTYERMVVVYGAPTNVTGTSVETSLLRALKDCGGIFGNEIWVAGNSAVVELKSNSKLFQSLDILKQNKTWYPIDDFLLYPYVNAYRVSQSLQTGDPYGDNTLMSFLRRKVSESTDHDQLSPKAEEVLSAIFMSCYASTMILFEEEDDDVTEDEFGTILLNQQQLSAKVGGNLMERFITAIKPESCNTNDFTLEIVKKFGEKRIRVIRSKTSSMQNPLPGSSSSKAQSQLLSELQEPSEVPDSNQELESDLPALKVSPGNIEDEGTFLQQRLILGLSQNGFLQWCTQLIRDNIQGLWNGIFSAGYDLRFDRAWPSDENASAASQYFANQWTKDKDAALISFIDSTVVALRVDPSRINPHEIYLTETDLANPVYRVLQGIPMEYLRVRAAMLLSLHALLMHDFLPLIGLHKQHYLKKSIASLLHDGRYLMFYDLKEFLIHKLLHASAIRGLETTSPEIFLDPVTAIEGNNLNFFQRNTSSMQSQGWHHLTKMFPQIYVAEDESDHTLINQAIPQLQEVSSSLYCVMPSTGSDPVLPVNIKYQGEEVLGLSGSFRHFMLNICKEFQRNDLKLLCKCPSLDAGKNKDSLILYPGPLSYKQEEFLYLLGQIIGIAIRTDTTVPISLLKVTWRSLLLSEKEINDATDDLVEADVLCANYIKKLQALTTQKPFESFLAMNGWPRFQYLSMGDASHPIPLCPGGKNLSVSFSNKEQFIRLLQKFRAKELSTENRVNRILAGLATIIPIPAILDLFTTTHLEYRICGSPQIDLAILKAHTHYQVGVSETDPHVLYFWSALESFTPEELRKFVKFACNLEHLPASCPCQSSNHEQQGFLTHVSPFPMKIAPTDLPQNMDVDEIDKRLIRVETCLFLIRLPPYSSLQVTKQQLLYAINCRDDPLSG